ncbi:hypothetical protein D3C72_2175160 [compost metagenome]
MASVCAMLLATGSILAASNLRRVSGSFITSWISPARRSAWALGMLMGAKKVFQPVAARSSPPSLKVGIFGSSALRLVPETARMRILPASCWGSIVSKVSNATGTWPPSRSLSSGAEPR